MTDRNAPCPCGSGKKFKKCCMCKQVDPTSALAREYKSKYDIELKTPEQIEGIRAACKLSANILKKLCSACKEGVATKEIDQLARKLTREAGATSAALNYGHPPFPGAVCLSLNEVICHGIPDDYKLQNGDIMNVDYACILNGYYGDNSAMVMIGDVSEEKQKVVEASYKCLMNSIEICKPGVPLNAIGDAITDTADEYGFSVVDQFVGHGVGVEFHEEPQVPHHRSKVKTPLAAGMTFTIEPMINVGKKGAVIDPDDEWTARTVDGKPSAQWEHTLLITEEGYEILTLPD